MAARPVSPLLRREETSRRYLRLNADVQITVLTEGAGRWIRLGM